jgi:glutathione S-transferase
MTLTLYVGNKRYSSWSLRPYLALVQTGLPFEDSTIWLRRDDTSAEILKRNPAGRVPVLDHDGLMIWESLAICEYLNELAPTAKLWPSDRILRARARSVATEMHGGFSALRTNMPMDICADKAGQGHTPEALADVRRVCDIWREALTTSGGPFLFGGPTIADAMFAPVATRFTTYGVDLDGTCRTYVATIAAMPAMKAWQRAADAEAPFAAS